MWLLWTTEIRLDGRPGFQTYRASRGLRFAVNVVRIIRITIDYFFGCRMFIYVCISAPVQATLMNEQRRGIVRPIFQCPDLAVLKFAKPAEQTHTVGIHPSSI